jgi:hypothetical protein
MKIAGLRPIFSDFVMYKFSPSVLFFYTKKKQTLCKSERLLEIGCLFQYINLGINPGKGLKLFANANEREAAV